VWETHGASFPSGEAQAKLALAATRRNPAERGRIAETSLGYMWASRKLGVLVVTLSHSGSPHHCSASAETHTVRFAPLSR
jgi:hypothetical protein